MSENEKFPELFGEPIYVYTRKQALEDGFQIDVSKIATEAGIGIPVYLNRTVWDSYVAVPAGVTAQDEQGRLWDIVWMLRHGIRTSKPGLKRIQFQLYVRNDNRRAKLVTLAAECGPMDCDDPRPAITVMMPDED